MEVECQSKAEGQEIETYGEIFENEGVKDMKREEKVIIVASGKTPKECSTQI